MQRLLLETGLFYIFVLAREFHSGKTMNINRWSNMQWITKTIFLGAFLCLIIESEAQEYRSISGYNNNLNNPELGTTNSMLAYWTRLDYADGIGKPKMDEEFGRPNPREISNFLFSQDVFLANDFNLSDYTWAFGQFLDHDITLVENSSFELLDNIIVPEDDKFFEPGSFIPMLRNLAAEGTGVSTDNPRRHVNHITSFVDGSAIYGSDEQTLSWLRGEKGKLRVSSGNLLPWNTIDGEFNSTIDPSAPSMADDTRTLRKYFVAGDIRANENPLLIGFHTLFLREHNRIAEELANDNVDWDSDKIFLEARKRNIAQLQAIVFNEWLPAMGVSLPPYSGYKNVVDPSISNVFSAAAFRLGHTLINGTILRINNQGKEMEQGNISLKDAFFNPYLIPLGGGIEPYFKGMGIQTQQKLDCKVIDDVRNFLFGAPGQGGMDLVSININRGRERGLADFNTVREDIGLPRIPSFRALTDNAEEAQQLATIYGDINNIDPWVGMLAEKKIHNTIFGETMIKILERQFQALRDGDRFYYENDPALSKEDVEEIGKTTLYDVLMRNTSLELMQPRLFIAMPHSEIPNGPQLKELDLEAAVYPNPVNQDFNLKVYSRNDKTVDISIISYTGQIISSRKMNLVSGENFIPMFLDDESCPRGLYNIMIRFGAKFTVMKVIKE